MFLSTTGINEINEFMNMKKIKGIETLVIADQQYIVIYWE
jgi:hypothetical protein